MPEHSNEVRISNVITLDKTNLDPGKVAGIRLKFSFDNPKFLENQRLGFRITARTGPLIFTRRMAPGFHFRGVL